MPEILAKFKVWANRKTRQHFLVYVFCTKRDMEAFYTEVCEECGGRPHRYDFAAVVVPWRRITCRTTGRGVVGTSLGLILFCHEYIGSGLVSHEMSHAAIHWMTVAHPRWVKIMAEDSRAAGQAQEEFCWMQGSLVNQFWRTFYRRGLDKVTP